MAQRNNFGIPLLFIFRAFYCYLKQLLMALNKFKKEKEKKRKTETQAILLVRR